MADATTIKVITTKAGKTKYQAQVWHKGIYYCSKVWDTAKLARDYKDSQLSKIAQGKLEPASVRKAKRRADADLDRPMTHWSALYVQEVIHGDSRHYDYKLVGTLLADKTLKDFNGKAGAQLIERLAKQWKFDRRPRSKKPRPANAPALAPLQDQSVRSRLTALMRLIRFAKSKLPEGTSFELPAMDTLFEFTLPPPHGNPRRRETEDGELAKLLLHFGTETDYGHFLRVIDETGCRLSEVRNAKGSDVHFFTVAGQVVGGHLTLAKHKTSAKVGTREVPLSLFAARLLHERKLRYGDLTGQRRHAPRGLGCGAHGVPYEQPEGFFQEGQQVTRRPRVDAHQFTNGLMRQHRLRDEGSLRTGFGNRHLHDSLRGKRTQPLSCGVTEQRDAHPVLPAVRIDDNHEVSQAGGPGHDQCLVGYVSRARLQSRLPHRLREFGTQAPAVHPPLEVAIPAGCDFDFPGRHESRGRDTAHRLCCGHHLGQSPTRLNLC